MNADQNNYKDMKMDTNRDEYSNDISISKVLNPILQDDKNKKEANNSKSKEEKNSKIDDTDFDNFDNIDDI